MIVSFFIYNFFFQTEEGWRVVALIDSPSAGSCLIPASLEPAQNSFLQREMGDSDGCPGNGDSAKPFPFSANEGWVGVRYGRGGTCNRGRHKVIVKHSLL